MAQGNYHEPFFLHRIVNLGWAGGLGVLTIDYPEGLSISFVHSIWSPVGHGVGPYAVDAVVPHSDLQPSIIEPADVAIFPVAFDHVIELETLYVIEIPGYSYTTVAGLSTVSGFPAEPWKAATSITFPGVQFFGPCVGTSPGPTPPYNIGLNTIDGPLIPPSCGFEPFNPGFDNYIAFFTEPVSRTETRKAVRKVWLINFANWQPGAAVEIRTNIEVADENLPSYNIVATLTRYAGSAVLRGSEDTVTGAPAGTERSLSTDYVAPSLGFIHGDGSITRAA